MNKGMKLSLVAGLILSSSVYALNPVPGFYAGILGEGSRGSSTVNNYTPVTTVPLTGVLKYNQLGGGGGLDLGYKVGSFRIEGEFLFNYNSFSDLNVNGCQFVTPNIITPIGTCPNDPLVNGLGFEGSTSAMFALVNGYFDLYLSNTESSLVPYAGIGIGRTRIKNVNNFRNTITQVGMGETRTANASAAQAIIGLGYYLDDYAWIGFDYRYLTTGVIPFFNNERYKLNTLNISASASFSAG